jgi:Rap1a immunity proteins
VRLRRVLLVLELPIGRQGDRSIKTLLAAVLVLAAGLAAPQARAIDTAGQVVDQCENSRHAIKIDGVVQGFESDSRTGYCWGAVSAVQDVGNILLESPNRTALWLCLPTKATTFDMVKIFIRCMDEHPNRRYERFGLVLLDSLREAYPCAKPGYRFR